MIPVVSILLCLGLPVFGLWRLGRGKMRRPWLIPAGSMLFCGAAMLKELYTVRRRLFAGDVGGIEDTIPKMIIPRINGFPTIILWALAAVVIVWFIWNKTTFGKNLYAVGGNPEAAAVSGISVFKVTVGAFIMAGVLYGFGSWLECIRMFGSGSAGYGQGWEMDAIAACVVGGVSFTGGIGKISGVVTGVFIFTALTYSLTTLGIDANLQFVISGIIILVAVMLDCLKYVQKK